MFDVFDSQNHTFVYSFQRVLEGRTKQDRACFHFLEQWQSEWKLWFSLGLLTQSGDGISLTPGFSSIIAVVSPVV